MPFYGQWWKFALHGAPAASVTRHLGTLLLSVIPFTQLCPGTHCGPRTGLYKSASAGLILFSSTATSETSNNLSETQLAITLPFCLLNKYQELFHHRRASLSLCVSERVCELSTLPTRVAPRQGPRETGRRPIQTQREVITVLPPGGQSRPLH